MFEHLRMQDYTMQVIETIILLIKDSSQLVPGRVAFEYRRALSIKDA
jgi:hypothetical protein